MNEAEKRVADAERSLRQACQILSAGGSYTAEEWLLLATLVGEADLILRDARRDIPRLQVPLFNEVMRDFREATSDFSNVEFLRASSAARRHNPELFKPLG